VCIHALVFGQDSTISARSIATENAVPDMKGGTSGLLSGVERNYNLTV
jgi:hypothetical protein